MFGWWTKTPGHIGRAQSTTGAGHRVQASNPVVDTGGSGGGGGSGSGGDGEPWSDVVLDDQRGSTAPPVSPTAGDRYIVPCGATGDWSGQDSDIAEWDGAQWLFTTPTEGAIVYVTTRDTFLVYVTANTTDPSIWLTISGTESFWVPMSSKTLTILPIVNQLNAPPGGETIYDAYIVDPTGSGDWTSRDNYIAFRICGSGGDDWAFLTPQEGMLVRDLTAHDFYYYDGSDWLTFTSVITSEIVQDWINDAFVAGTQTGITVTYNDGSDSWDFAIDDEYIQDLVAALLLAGTDISITYDDGGNLITISYVGGGAGVSTSYYRPTVLDKDVATPPGTPNDGDAYIVPAGATGAWTGHAKDIATWDAGGGTWVFTVPVDGYMVWVTDENIWYVYNSSAWEPLDVTIQTAVLEEWVEDVVNGLLVAGTDIQLTYNDGANTLTIAYNGTASIPSNVVRGSTNNYKIDAGVAYANASGIASVTFSNAFSSTPAVTCTPVRFGSSQVVFSLTAVNTTGFGVVATLVGPGGTGGPAPTAIHWHAVGVDTSP
jgi:hypothetical protein